MKISINNIKVVVDSEYLLYEIKEIAEMTGCLVFKTTENLNNTSSYTIILGYGDNCHKCDLARKHIKRLLKHKK